MTETEQVDPVEATKDQELVKGMYNNYLMNETSAYFKFMYFVETQQEILKLDILVCGVCHDVFHCIEGFQEHKADGVCTGTSTLRDENSTDQKTQVWGFLLWKNAKFKKDPTDQPTSSWTIYQLWCNLDVNQKDTWISAGQSVLSSYKIGTAKLQDTKTSSSQVFNKI